MVVFAYYMSGHPDYGHHGPVQTVIVMCYIKVILQ